MNVTITNTGVLLQSIYRKGRFYFPNFTSGNLSLSNFLKAGSDKKYWLLLTFLGLFQIVQPAFSCSTYKVSFGGKTMHGVNYDAWFTKPRIWFENEGYGAVFTGANFMGADGFTPQSGMNIHGLTFATLATLTPENGSPQSGKKPIVSRARYLKDILHHCQTVEEVQRWIHGFDHSQLSKDVFLYTDQSGKYLIVEPFKMTIGTDDRYVLANFCPSTISDFSSIKQPRYVNGRAFLKNKTDTSLAFCTALSDTMHVCRTKMGDGTLLTSIWDGKLGLVTLYFYHNYKNSVQFNLQEELLKGDHAFEIPALFPQNAEYEKLLGYKIPLLSAGIDRMLLLFCALFFGLTLYFPVSYLRGRNQTFAGFKWGLSLLSFVMAAFCGLLAKETGIYFFPVPYQIPGAPVLSLISYTPFFVLILALPLIWLNIKVWTEKSWSGWSIAAFVILNVSIIVLIGFFIYWGLLGIEVP